LLRHIADHFFDRLGISHDVMPANSRGSIARFENSAQHPNHSRFAGAVGTEKAENRSLADGKRNVIDSRERAEALRQPLNFDHRLSHKKESGKQEKAGTRCPNALSRARAIGFGDKPIHLPAFLLS
jgi:hypothetical protein